MRAFINNLGNSLIPRLLGSPLHFLVSGHVMLVTFTGRKSGKVYTTPVEYCRDNERVVFFTQRGRVWWKNLQDGASVTVRIAGRDLTGRAQAITDERVIQTAFASMHPHAKINPEQIVMVQIRLSTVAERYTALAAS